MVQLDVRLHRPERDRSAQSPADLVDGVSGGLRRGERCARFGQQRTPGVSQRDGVGGAVKQPQKPSSFSRLRTPADTADWTTRSRSAARVKLPASATATKVAS
jgi:hypothetical protein